MVDAMTWDYRDPNLADYARYPILKELKRNHYFPKILELNIQQEAPDGALAEIMVDYTVIFNGTATAALVHYDSSDAKDTVAGVGARTIKILSVNEAGDDYQENTDDMAGQTGTPTTEKHQRLIAVKVMSCGAEGDVAGTLTIQDDIAGANKHMTIAAGDNSSISARLYMPDDWEGLMYYLKASVTEVVDATAEIILDTGFQFTPIVHDAPAIALVAPDDPEVYSVSSSRPPVELWNVTPIVPSNSGANYISLKHNTKEEDNNALALYKIIYIMWGTLATHRQIRG